MIFLFSFLGIHVRTPTASCAFVHAFIIFASYKWVSQEINENMNCVGWEWTASGILQQ